MDWFAPSRIVPLGLVVVAVALAVAWRRGNVEHGPEVAAELRRVYWKWKGMAALLVVVWAVACTGCDMATKSLLLSPDLAMMVGAVKGTGFAAALWWTASRGRRERKAIIEREWWRKRQEERRKQREEEGNG